MSVVLIKNDDDDDDDDLSRNFMKIVFAQNSCTMHLVQPCFALSSVSLCPTVTLSVHSTLQNVLTAARETEHDVGALTSKALEPRGISARALSRRCC